MIFFKFSRVGFEKFVEFLDFLLELGDLIFELEIDICELKVLSLEGIDLDILLKINFCQLLYLLVELIILGLDSLHVLIKMEPFILKLELQFLEVFNFVLLLLDGDVEFGDLLGLGIVLIGEVQYLFLLPDGILLTLLEILLYSGELSFQSGIFTTEFMGFRLLSLKGLFELVDFSTQSPDLLLQGSVQFC